MVGIFFFNFRITSFLLCGSSGFSATVYLSSDSSPIIGLLLAVAYADDKIRIISSYSGRTVHQYLARQQRLGEDMISDPQCHSTITCLGWGINFTDSKAAERQLHNVDGPVRVEDLFAPDTHPSKAKSLLRADLPRELALLDVEGSLPKLSTLPATGSE